MRIWLAILCIALLSAGCDNLLLGDENPIVSLEENLQRPVFLNDGWNVSDPTSENIDSTKIHRLVSLIQKNPNNIHSLVVIRNNKLILESYFTGWNRDRVHALRSASKTFVSTLMGIAIDRGHFKTNQKVHELLPEYAQLKDGQKNQIEVFHLLSMTSGIRWDERTFASDDPRNDETNFDESKDRFTYLLEKDMADLPGSKFEYNSALPVVEAAILKNTTGMDVPEFAQNNLFSQLNITNYYWRTNPDDGYITAIGPLFLIPRDMAKLGQLFLDSGSWKGDQIVSKQWVKDATLTIKGDEAAGQGYGYHWWTGAYMVDGNLTRIYSAQGSGGQYIFVAPQFNAVVVFTGGNYSGNQAAPIGMLINVILPAMR